MAEPDLKSVGFGDVTIEIFITTPLLEKADEFNRVLNNLGENTISEIRHGENAKILEQYERITGQVLARIQKWYSWTISTKNNLYAAVVKCLMECCRISAAFFCKNRKSAY